MSDVLIRLCGLYEVENRASTQLKLWSRVTLKISPRLEP
jgi:hypothetical protein